jgi:hypothetical protein
VVSVVMSVAQLASNDAFPPSLQLSSMGGRCRGVSS